jgi:hypothetical protein
MTHRFIKSSGTTFAALSALTVASAASAAIDPTKYVGWDYWTGTGPAGYTDMTGSGAGTDGALLSVQTDCGPFGCFTLPQATGLTGNALKGFVRFQFENFNYVNYTGLWFWLQFEYTPSPTVLNPNPSPQTLTTGQQTAIINAVNGQTYGLTGTSVTAHTAQTASQQTDAFANFLPSSMSNPNNIFFNWYPTPSGPTTSGLSQVFVFAWDFSNVATVAGNSTWEIGGAGAVPAPGAIALLGLGGLIGSGRRRRS